MAEQTKDHNDTARSRRYANIILYCIVTGMLALLAGIVLNVFNKLPSQLVRIATAVAGLLVLFSGVFGAIIGKSVEKGFTDIWKNANRRLMIMFGTLTVIFLTLLVLLVPTILKGMPYQPTGTVPAITTLNASLTNPYPPHKGTLDLNNSFTEITYPWDASSTCQFKNMAYHVKATNGSSTQCMYNAGYFGNFVYQVQMKFITKDTCGGIIFRDQEPSFPALAEYYEFYICTDGKYRFRYGDTDFGILANGFSLFNTDVGLASIIAVVANGNQFELYINGQRVNGATDNSFHFGTISVFVTYLSNSNASNEVAFNYLKVWTL
jgi:hypothetical protein